MILPSIAPQFRGSGLSSGLTHRLRYSARLSNNATGQNGNSWIVTSLPYLHYSAETTDDMPEKVILTGVGGAQWEWVSGTGYVGLFGTTRRLDIDGTNLRMLKPDGSTITFFGPSAASSIRGRQQGAVSALGIVTVVAYDAHSRIASETRTDPTTGDQATIVYTFATTGPHTGRILAVEKRLIRSGAVIPLHRWDFTYHTGEDGAGNPNDLKTAGESVWSEADTAWSSIGKRYFRYYTGDSGIGFVHGLRYVLDADGYARMRELGLDPEDLSQVPDAVLAGFATESFEYDADRRHSKVVARAGSETTTYDRLNSDGDPARNWSRREIAHQPDRSTLTTYFDQAGRTVFKLLQSNGDAWPEYWEFNADNRETLHATAASITSFAVSDLIVRFINGDVDDMEWDDFESIPLEDDYHEMIRMLVWSVAKLFPASSDQEYCGVGADLFFLKIAEMIQNSTLPIPTESELELLRLNEIPERYRAILNI